MDVLFWIIWRVELDDPVNIRNVKPACCNVRAQQRAALCLAKVEERRRTLRLLLLAVDVSYRYVYIIQQLGVVLHRGARREKHHDLFPSVALEESEQEKETLF